MEISSPTSGLGLSVSHMKRLIFATAIVAAISGAACVPSQAADFGLGVRPATRHAGTAWHYWNWRDRCAWAGYYCLYAYDGYIYHYPWDDRPSAYTYRRH